MTNSTRLVAVAALAVIALVGCGDSDDSEAGIDTTAPEVADEGDASTSTTEAAPADDSAAGELTPQGTELDFGEVATVPFQSQDQTGAIGVTVVDIIPGTEAELAQLELGDRAAGLVPYYITFEVTNESGSDFSFSSLSGVHGLLDDGSPAQSVSVIGEFVPCDNGDGGADFNTEGASYTTCSVELAPPGAMVVGAAYTSYDSTVNTAAGTNYGEEPIVWK